MGSASGCAASSFDPQHVGHRVEAGFRLVGEPEACAHGAAREALAALRAVGELEPFAMAQKVDRMVADHVAAAQSHHADLVVAPLADRSLARRDLRALEAAAERLCEGSA